MSLSIHQLLDYYKAQEAKATKQLVALEEGLNKHSCEEAVEYYRGQRRYYEKLCSSIV
jgi:hypothetical protein